MKKVKPVSLKTIVLGRTGKTVMHTPLAVSSNAAGSQLNQGTSSRTEAVDVDNHDVPVFSPDEAQHSTAQRRNYNSVVNWEKMRDKLFMAAVEEESLPEKAVCVVCKQRESTVRCRYCGPRQFFCSTCAHDLHAERNQFHVLEQWKDNRFIPLFPNHGAIESGHSCSSRVLKLFKLIDAFGNQHLFEVPVCDCESHAVTLVRCQFWPGSPERPSVGSEILVEPVLSAVSEIKSCAMTSNLLAALKSNQGKTSTTAVYPLIEAAKSGQVEGCSKALEDKKVKVDQKDPEGVNALMHAASGGYIQVVQFLVDKGARISAKDDMGETALMKACKEGHTDIIRFLVEAQAAQRKKGPSLTGGKDEAQQSLMREKKRILDMKDDEGVTAIMKAAEQGEGDVVQILADDGASLDLKDDEGWDVLMWASLSGHYEICELLVSNFGITADYATEKGETALMKAAANGHWDVCGFLIGEGAKVNQLDQHHQTALMWAASEGHLTTVQGLVKKDAKVDQVTKQGKTALLLAAQFGREEICKFLVAKGAKVEHQDEDGQTALFSAVQAGNPSLVKSLIELKCPTEAKTSRGETALIWAAMNQQLLCVQALLAHGANVHTTDENGQTAQDHAEGTLNSHVVEVLREAAKTQSKKDEE